jgi:membrane protein YdbS with pleckstrin-like domain
MAARRRPVPSGEEVVVELRPHWASLGWPLVALIGAVVVVVAVAAAFPGLPVAVSDAMLAVLLVVALWLSLRWTRRRATSLVVTTDRLVTRAGILGRRGTEVRLDQIASLSHHQSLFERAVGTGHLVVERIGTPQPVIFDHVPRPAAVHRVVADQAALARAPGGTRSSAFPAAPAPPGPTPSWRGDTPPAGVARVDRVEGSSASVGARLAELAELYRRGLVTDAEYSSKRMELLDQL